MVRQMVIRCAEGLKVMYLLYGKETEMESYSIMWEYERVKPLKKRGSKRSFRQNRPEYMYQLTV